MFYVQKNSFFLSNLKEHTWLEDQNDREMLTHLVT